MFNHKKPEVVVAGAGPVGLFAALSLARRGVRVEIVEEEWRSTTRSYALALHPRSLELLGELGLAAELLERARPVKTVGLYDGVARRDEIDLSKISSKFPFLAILPQLDLEELLIAALDKLGVKVEWNHRLAFISSNGGHAEATIDTLEQDSAGYAISQIETIVQKSTTLKPPFVIAADGHESVARTQLGIKFDSVRPSERFVVFEFDAEGELPDEVCVVLDKSTTNVLWPMPKGRYRWSFQVPPSTSHEDTRLKDRLVMEAMPRHPELGEEMLREAIELRAPWFKGEPTKLRWSTVVDFDYRLAREFGKGRVWLAGDAGHMTGPVGAQSMNIGLKEASELAQIVAGILHGRTALSALDAYGERRRIEWKELLGMGGTGLETRADAKPWVAENAARLVPCIPASGAHFGQIVERLGFAHA
jgi:2-polyprenyl-6-methoxyphenol hydroxylase-like FAD-dependent oxidoreductase